MNRTQLFVLVAVVVVIVGCSLLSCIAAAAPALLFFRSLKENPAYQMGIDLARNDPAVVELFGSPIEDGFFANGEIQTGPEGSGTANLETSLSGPKARGTITIYGSQADKGSAWQIESINIRVDDKLVLSYQGSEADKGFQPAP